jgi:hypothetical protein
MGGTGRVCSGLSNILTEKGIENYILFASNDMQSKTNISYGSSFQIKLQALKSKLFGKYGFNSKGMTKKLINELDRIKPVGGGGTSFESIFKSLPDYFEEGEYPVAIVIMTDGHAPFPDEAAAMGIPVFWIIVNSDVEPPWGEVAHVDTKN